MFALQWSFVVGCLLPEGCVPEVLIRVYTGCTVGICNDLVSLVFCCSDGSTTKETSYGQAWRISW